MQDFKRRQRILDQCVKHEANNVTDMRDSGEYSLFLGLRGGFSAADEQDAAEIQEIFDNLHISDILAKLRA